MTLTDLPQAVKDLRALQLSSGFNLDKIAGRYGLSRKDVSPSQRPIESDNDFRVRIDYRINVMVEDLRKSITTPEHPGVSAAQAMVDLQGASSLAGEDLDRLGQRYGIERDGAEADYWFRVRIQRAADSIIWKARYWGREHEAKNPTPSGREVFEREYLAKIEPKRYTLAHAFDILLDGIHPASFKAESGLTSSESVEAVRVIRAMMGRNMDKEGSK